MADPFVALYLVPATPVLFKAALTMRQCRGSSVCSTMPERLKFLGSKSGWFRDGLRRRFRRGAWEVVDLLTLLLTCPVEWTNEQSTSSQVNATVLVVDLQRLTEVPPYLRSLALTASYCAKAPAFCNACSPRSLQHGNNRVMKADEHWIRSLILQTLLTGR